VFLVGDGREKLCDADGAIRKEELRDGLVHLRLIVFLQRLKRKISLRREKLTFEREIR